MRTWPPLRLWTLLLLARTATAHIESCAGACELALSHLVFPDVNPSLGYYPNQCGSLLRVTSVYVCMRSYCRPRETSVGWKLLNGDCEQYGNLTLPPLSIIDNVTDEQIARYLRFGLAEFDVGLELDEPAFPERALFDAAYRTKDVWNDSVATRHAYGNAMFYFWAAVLLLGVGNRVWTCKRLTIAEPAHRSSRRWTRLLQRLLTIPATFSHHCAEPIGWCTIPPRLQTCTLILFAIINAVLCCVDYRVFDTNLYWTTSVQWSRYIGDRTGILATANLPILWLFATRNNMLLALTGWSFETAMAFHRWVARIATAEAVVHSVAYTAVVLLPPGSWSHYWAEWRLRYWAMGALATLVMCLLCAFSVYPLRQHRYELFLLLHISLGLLTLLGMWYHVEIFEGAYNWYLWPCLAIWALDRVMRLGRLAYLNFPLRTSSAVWDAKANVVTLSVPSAVSRRPRPGEYYFLYLLHDRTFYESHPFTLSSWSTGGLLDKGKPSLNFLIRPYDGFTRRLADLARNTGAAKTRILLEGPYGPAHDLTHHDSLVFVVGGTGIAAALAYLTDMCTRIQHSKHQPYRARHVRIVWAVQHLAMFNHVYEQEIQPRMAAMAEGSGEAGFKLELDIYITRASTSQAHAPLPEPTRPASPPRDLDAEQDDYPQSQSENSPLLSSSTSPSASPPRAPSPLPTPTGTDHITIPPATLPSPADRTNTTLTLHHLTRPEIPALLSAACRRTGGGANAAVDTATATSISISISNGTSTTPLRTATIEEETEPKSTSSQPAANHGPRPRPLWRIAILSCGPASLADATRAGVVRALASVDGDGDGGVEGGGEAEGRGRGGDVDVDVSFYSESYSW